MYSYQPDRKETPYAGPRLEVRSEEVQDILGQMPGWTIRWGITVVFGVVATILLAGWVVRYPDTVEAKVELTTRTPPASHVARTDGRLTLLVRNNQPVRPGDYLAVLENAARTGDVNYLAGQLAAFRAAFHGGRNRVSALSFRDQLQLGELQAPYVAFLSSLSDYTRSRSLLAHDQQIGALRARTRQYGQLAVQLEKQSRLLAEELGLAEKRLRTDQQLFGEKVLSEADFDRSKNSYLQSQRAFESARKDIISNQIALSQLETQIAELGVAKVDTEEKLRNAVESTLRTLESQLMAWQQRYLLRTPIAGRVAFSKYWSNNQFVKAGEEVLTVVPPSGEIYGQILVPVAGSGKVAVGQKVFIRFDNYPAPEYGMVTGLITSIAPVPREGFYTVQIRLPRGLTTSYRKQLAFRQQMQGSAEIITRDRRLIERIFSQLRSLLDNATT